MCPHTPPCPAPSAPDREAAHTIVSHPEQGWSLLCNGVVLFDDAGVLVLAGPPRALAVSPRYRGRRERQMVPSTLVMFCER